MSVLAQTEFEQKQAKMQIEVGNLAAAGWPAAKIAAHMGIHQAQVMRALEAMGVRIVRPRAGLCPQGHQKRQYQGKARCLECYTAQKKAKKAAQKRVGAHH